MVVSRRLMAAMSRRCMTPESCVQLLMYKRVRKYHLKLKGCLIYDVWRFNDKPFAKMYESLWVCVIFLFLNCWSALLVFVGSLKILNFWWHLPRFWSQGGSLHYVFHYLCTIESSDPPDSNTCQPYGSWSPYPYTLSSSSESQTHV